MNYCCICCRETNHPKSFHCSINDNVYHYCHRHAFIGRRVSDEYTAKKVRAKDGIEIYENDIYEVNKMIGYVEVPKNYEFGTEFPTWIIAFCPDSNSWFVTNERFFFYEYNKEFETEEEGIKFFKDNPKIFYDEEVKMKICRPLFYENDIWLENTREFIKI